MRCGAAESRWREPTAPANAGLGHRYEGRSVSFTCTVWLVPFRLYVSETLSPGRRELIAARSSPAELICLPANAVITSPPRRPARAAGVSGLTLATAAPDDASRSTMPRNACCAFPLEISCETIE